MDARFDSNSHSTHSTEQFEVELSQVRGELRTAEARPVFLTFNIDNGAWIQETDVYSADVNPVWKFSTPSSQPTSKSSTQSTHFTYSTDAAHRFHRMFLSVTLSERSVHGDVSWGSGTISLDSLALGCANIALNMIAQDDATCYGTIRFKISMMNVTEVSAHLSELKLIGCAKRFVHDVKLVYFELGMGGFEKGYRHCTERSSDAEPLFRSKPVLKRECNLHEMVSPSPNTHGPLRVYFSVQRQVARNRTEQIGVGALPIRMLFRKVSNGYMDTPTKFKVPLQNKQGTLKGKILLRNIPRFHQLIGDDLVNVNGVITPVGEDLELRKLAPWIKLPKPLVPEVHQSPPQRLSNTEHELKVLESFEGTSNFSSGDHSGEDVLFNYELPDGVANLRLDGTSGASLSIETSGSITSGQFSKVAKSAASISTAEANTEASVPGEWVAVEDPTTGLHYFASKATHESLWLPPDWEHQIDGDGRSVFVDYSSGARHHVFPAKQARKYREAAVSPLT